MSIYDQGKIIADELGEALVPRARVQYYPAEAPVECCDECPILDWWVGPITPREIDDWDCTPLDALVHFRLSVCFPTIDDDGNFDHDAALVVAIKMADYVTIAAKLLQDIACTSQRMAFFGAQIAQPQGGCLTAALQIKVVVT